MLTGVEIAYNGKHFNTAINGNRAKIATGPECDL